MTDGSPNQQSYLLQFNLDDPQERKAYDVYKYYSERRAFKGLIVSFLLAIWTIEEQTNRVIGIAEFMGLFLGSIINGTAVPQLGRFVPTLTEDGELPDMPSLIDGGGVPEIDVSIGREEHTQGVAAMFDDGDDLWDD